MKDDDEVIRRAIGILEDRMIGEGMMIGHPTNLFTHAYLELANERNEVLLGYWLGEGNRLLGWDRIAYGSDVRASFSLRHAARLAIAADAISAVFLHNHPRGATDPSTDDIEAADKLDKFMATVNVLAIGHYIMGKNCIRSIRGSAEFEIVESAYTGPRCPHCNGKLEQETAE